MSTRCNHYRQEERRACRSPPPLPLFFSVHSGTGARSRPPSSYWACTTGRCPYGSCAPEDGDAERNTSKITSKSSAILSDARAPKLDKSRLVQPLPAMTTERCKQCKEVLRLCPRIDLDPHQLVLAKEDRNRARWPWSNAGNNTAKADCQQNFVHLQPTRVARGCCKPSTTRATCCRGVRGARSASDRSTIGSLRSPLERIAPSLDCKAIAARLTRSGLPLRRELVALVPRLFPNPCDVCIYVRLHDRRNKTLANLHEALYSWTGRRLVQLIDRHRNDPKQVRAGGVSS